MTQELTRLLAETGLIQFGRFQNGAETRPFLLSFDYLPAYPPVLEIIAQTAQWLLDRLTIHRLVATADSVPFGVAVSLQADISLVYSRGTDKEAVYDLAGAYNIGHAAVLLINVLEDTQPLIPFIHSARRVGLEIHTLLAVLDLGTAAPIPGIAARSILTLPAVVRDLTAKAFLPTGQAEAVMDWVETRRLILHPGAASP